MGTTWPGICSFIALKVEPNRDDEKDDEKEDIEDVRAVLGVESMIYSFHTCSAICTHSRYVDGYIEREQSISVKHNEFCSAAQDQFGI